MYFYLRMVEIKTVQFESMTAHLSTNTSTFARSPTYVCLITMAVHFYNRFLRAIAETMQVCLQPVTTAHCRWKDRSQSWPMKMSYFINMPWPSTFIHSILVLNSDRLFLDLIIRSVARKSLWSKNRRSEFQTKIEWMWTVMATAFIFQSRSFNGINRFK